MSDREIHDKLDPKVWIDGAPITQDSIDGHAANLIGYWRVAWKDYIIVNRKTPFYTDFASIPDKVKFVFARIFPARSIYDYAAIAHDIAYSNGWVYKDGVRIPIDREYVDEMFYDLMVNLIKSVNPNPFLKAYYITRAKLMYQCVSWGGKSTWDGYRKVKEVPDNPPAPIAEAPLTVSRDAVQSARERAKRA